jgi:DNA-binding NtrC family response regulator
MAAKLRVLIIDDEAALSRALIWSLPDTWAVSSETDSRKALDRLLEEEFDAVVLDLMIPHMSGMLLFQELAARRPAVCAQVIFITGGLYIPAVKAFAATVPQHIILEKPFTVTELVNAILHLTGKHNTNGTEKP